MKETVLAHRNMRNVKFYQKHGYVLCNQRGLAAGGEHSGPFNAVVYSFRRRSKE